MFTDKSYVILYAWENQQNNLQTTEIRMSCHNKLSQQSKIIEFRFIANLALESIHNKQNCNVFSDTFKLVCITIAISNKNSDLHDIRVVSTLYSLRPGGGEVPRL